MFTNKSLPVGRQGFTLVEVLVVIGIVSVTFSAMFSLSNLSYVDPLDEKYEEFLASIYKTREMAVQNPEEEFLVDISNSASPVMIAIEGKPKFVFGEIGEESKITFTYANRIRRIIISELGAIEH